MYVWLHHGWHGNQTMPEGCNMEQQCTYVPRYVSLSHVCSLIDMLDSTCLWFYSISPPHSFPTLVCPHPPHPSSEKTISCDPLTPPENGRATMSGNSVGSSATYTCFPGFNLQGSSTAQCQSTGQWTPNAPTCSRKFVLPFALTNEVAERRPVILTFYSCGLWQPSISKVWDCHSLWDHIWLNC